MELKVYDTSELLAAGEDLHLDEESYISIYVLGELENIKTAYNKDTEVKAAARRAVNVIKSSKSKTDLVKEKELNGLMKKYGYALEDKNDTKIIFEAILLSRKYSVSFYTGDYAQYLIAQKLTETIPNMNCVLVEQESKERFWDGYKIVHPTEQQLADLANIACKDNIFDCEVNEYVSFEQNGEEHLCRWTGEEYVQTGYENIRNDWFGKIRPRSMPQQVYFDLLQNPEIPVVSCLSKRGMGKTFLAIVNGLDMVSKGMYDKVLYLRNNWALAGSQDISALPGDEKTKILPYLYPVIDIVGGEEAFDSLVQQGILDYMFIGFIRGRSFSRSYIVVDEAQNLTKEMLAAIVSRLGEGSKIVFCSDYKQIDNPLFMRSNGMLKMNKTFKGNSLFGQVRLTKVARSKVCELADLLD